MAAKAGRYDENLLQIQGSGKNVFALAGATVEVFESDGVTNATLYDDRDKTPYSGSGSVVETDDYGNLEFFADPGIYKLQVSVDGKLVRTDTVNVSIDGEEAASIGTLSLSEDQTVTGDWEHTGTLTGTTVDVDTLRAKGPLFDVTHPDFGVAADGDASGGGTDNAAGLQAAIDAAETAGGGTVLLPAGTTEFGSTLNRPKNVALLGRGRTGTRLHYTGSGTAISQASSGSQQAGGGLRHMWLSSSSGALGVDFDSIAETYNEDFVVTGFTVGLKIHSVKAGLASYNVFVACKAQSCPTGWLIDTGANENEWIASRANNCSTVGFKFQGTNNHNKVLGGATEACGVAFDVAGTNTKTKIRDVRIENNTTGVSVGASAIGTEIVDPYLVSNGTNISDSGTRTIVSDILTSQVLWQSQQQVSDGSFRFVRLANGGSEVPAMVVRDDNDSSGTPVTMQVEMERSDGFFVRCIRSAINWFEVNGFGDLTTRRHIESETGQVRLNEVSSPGNAGTDQAWMFARDSIATPGKTELCVRFQSGGTQIIATEP